MKNIHVLQTDKPSILIKDIWKNTFSLVENFDTSHTDFKAQNLYITSDEEIKEGDWCLYNKNHNSRNSNWELVKCGVIEREEMHPISDGRLLLWMVKIILTTDQNLIKSGVQAIDDEFLEWFVKNPSCEEVEVGKSKKVYVNEKLTLDNKYFLIIPKEETKLKNICIKCGVDLYAAEGRFECQKHPKECKGIYLSKETLLIHAAEQKQHLTDMMKADEELGLYEEPKQETLEEVAEREASLFYEKGSFDWNKYRQVFIEGVKCQMERSYSEEEVKDIIAETWIRCVGSDGNNFKEARDKILEQFKKK